MFGQSITGDILGTVYDSTKAVVPVSIAVRVTLAPATTAPVATAVSGIAIDIASGETTTTIYPGDTAALSVDNGRIDVTVRFLRPLTDAERQAIRVSVNSPKWEVEAKTTPAEDAYAFVLRGATPTALIVQMSSMPGPTTVRFTIRVSSPSARLATSNI